MGAVITGGGESRARVVYAIIGAMALLLGVARFAPSDMAPTAYGASDIGDPSASATGQVDPKAVGELTAPTKASQNHVPIRGTKFYVSDELPETSRDKYVDGNVYGSFTIAGDTPAVCVDLAGADPKYASAYVVADSNTTPSHERDNRTFNVDTDLARKFAAKWGDALASHDWQTIASQSGVAGADATNAQLAASMAVWSLQGRPIDRQVVRWHVNGTHISNVDDKRTQEVRKIAQALVSQAENYSAPSDEAEPATVKISQGDRTENGDGTVIPISVSGSSD
ncbi:MAG: hypothetical protein E7K68_05795, partial [Corynebacterium kroppenstedtii]|nr:hypothetical protein [Corynebacterium kroppenstedtii]